MALLAFHEVLFPVNISYGSTGGPGFKTGVFEADSGYEQRNVGWSFARGYYDVSQGVKTPAQMDELNQFFINRKARLFGFRFRDWNDYQVVNEQIGVGDGATTIFQMTSTYVSAQEESGESYSYTRLVRKVEWDSVTGVTLAGSPKLEGTDFTIDYDTGLLTFGSAPLAITVFGSHAYWRVRMLAAQDSSGFIDVTQLEFRATPGGSTEATGGTPLSDPVSALNFTGPVAAFDADDTTRWALGGAPTLGTQYLGYHFTAPVVVQAIAIRSFTNPTLAPKDFSVEYSDDGVTWTTAWTVLGATPWTTALTTVAFTAPPPAIVIGAYNFHLPVRFDTEHFDATIETFGTTSWPNIPILEIRDWGSQSFPTP